MEADQVWWGLSHWAVKELLDTGYITQAQHPVTQEGKEKSTVRQSLSQAGWSGVNIYMALHPPAAGALGRAAQIPLGGMGGPLAARMGALTFANVLEEIPDVALNCPVQIR